MTSTAPTPPRRRRGRRATILVALGVVVVAGLVAASPLRDLLRGAVSAGEAPVPTAGPPSAPAGPDPRGCDAPAGDLRFDTAFTGADGKAVP